MTGPNRRHALGTVAALAGLAATSEVQAQSRNSAENLSGYAVNLDTWFKQVPFEQRFTLAKQHNFKFIEFWSVDRGNGTKASTLRGIVIPPYGGNTLIANTGAAYRDLPDTLRAFADTLRAVHTNDYDYAVPPESLNEAERERRKIFLSTRYETAHPVVRVHPLTGERGLFIGDFAQRIAGLAKGESYELLKILQQYVTRPENILRVTWEPGQLVLFDNRITQHYAVDNYDDAPRRLNRVTVAGDIPVGIDGSPSYSVKGDASHYTPVAAIQAA